MDDSFARRLAEAARHWTGAETVADTARQTVEFATAAIDGCDAARIGVVRRDGSGRTIAATDETARQIGELQYRLGEGPSIEALAQRSTVYAEDLEGETRWPEWAPRVAASAGLSAVLSVPLSTADQEVGIVDLFGKRSGAFDADAMNAAEVFAAHVSSHLAMTDAIENLSAALATRTVIGQAEGILMERFQVDSGRAFSILRRVSQDTNTRLARVAEELVETRRTPGAHEPQ